MARVLVVYHDVDVADIEVDELRRAGYEVDQCAGPIGGDPCPVASGQPCWQVERADVLVYDIWEGGHGHTDLIADVRAVHPDKPIILTSSGSTLDSLENDPRFHGVPVLHAPTRASLIQAIERALAARAATAPTAEPTAAAAEQHPAYSGPRW
jgi:DNA-binding NtrC family response regulator